MQANNPALQLGIEIGHLLARYVAVHDECFASSIRRVIPIPGIFKPIDFKQLHMRLREIYIELQKSQRKIHDLQEGGQINPQWARFSQALSEYSGSVAQSVGWLSSICSHLSDRVDGREYRATKYKEDLIGYETSIDRYRVKGAELNELLRSASSAS
jgi:hypothetical protein